MNELLNAKVIMSEDTYTSEIEYDGKVCDILEATSIVMSRVVEKIITQPGNELTSNEIIEMLADAAKSRLSKQLNK